MNGIVRRLLYGVLALMGTLGYDIGLLLFPICGIPRSRGTAIAIAILCSVLCYLLCTPYTVTTCVDHDSPPCDRDRIEIS